LSPSVLERYRGVVDEWDAFRAASVRPLPTCLLVNRLRTDRAALRARLADDGLRTRPVAWTEEALLLADDASPGVRVEYLTGLYTVQEEAALTAVHLLDPQPGERVLDLCSAPGNKTAQIAIRMEDRGTVVANDRSHQRMRATRNTLDRLGITNVTLTHHDGANFPSDGGTYDRILVDAPCSCEGTSRKNPDALDGLDEASIASLGGVQTALLRKAFQLCRPGGRIVYATCTYAPEENEAVVDRALRGSDWPVRLVDARIEGFVHRPGLTDWRDASYRPSLAGAMRVYPHHNDTGGFFVAVLERQESA